MSLEDAGNANIYAMDLRSRRTMQLTKTQAIDTAPCYSPDGRQIVFETDREGSQQIYVMNADGSGQHRISSGKGSYSTPVWSPRGDLVAFTKRTEGQFLIGVMKPDGSGERILTEGFHNEGPTWAPNGRVLMFFRATTSGRWRRRRSAPIRPGRHSSTSLQRRQPPVFQGGNPILRQLGNSWETSLSRSLTILDQAA